MRMKQIAGCGFLLNTIFFATYYSVAKEALNRIDPIVFTFFEMVALVPIALLIILCSWKNITRATVRRGILLGSTLCLALFTIAIALKYTTATSTGFFPALNGFLAAIIAWVVFLEPAKPHTWLAGLLSLGGAALLIFSSSIGDLRGTLIAFLGGLFYTFYIFLCDHEQKNEQEIWPLFGIELLSTAAWACLVVLLFGDWQAVHPILPKDIGIVLYVSLACTFVPTLISVLLQKYISPVTVSFIYILEPILGAVMAFLYLHEVLPIQGYIGGGLVVIGALVNTLGQTGKSSRKAAVQKRGSWVSNILYPGLAFLLGTLLLYRLGGLPPQAWQNALQAWPQLGQDMQNGEGTYVMLLLVQAGCWLLAWISVMAMGMMAAYHFLQWLSAQTPEQRRREALDREESLRPAPIQLTTMEMPSQRARTTVRLPAYPAQTQATVARSSERQGPPSLPGVARSSAYPRPGVARTNERQFQPGPAPLPRQSNDAIWEGTPGFNSGTASDIPFTEPLMHDVVEPLKRRASLAQQRMVAAPSLESLDA